MHLRPNLRCYAHGHDNAWEAICVDFDIAVQGSSFDEVKALLEESVAAYVEAARLENPEVRRQLLSRRTPWSVVAKLWMQTAIFNLFDRRQREAQASFPLACPA